MSGVSLLVLEPVLLLLLLLVQPCLLFMVYLGHQGLVMVLLFLVNGILGTREVEMKSLEELNQWSLCLGFIEGLVVSELHKLILHLLVQL